MNKRTECARLAILIDRLLINDFDPWEDANDDLSILEHFKAQDSATLSDYKDALYHETKGHGTHNVWAYKKGKFANAAIMFLNR